MNHITKLVCVVTVCGFTAPRVTAHEPIRAEFTTSDGVKIVGDYWTPLDTSQAAPVVILLHMYKSDRKAWAPQIVSLEKEGFAILAIDLRGHGESHEPAEMNLVRRVGARDLKLFQAMHLDVEAAYEWLAKRSEVDLSRFAIIGASVGCSVALDYCRRDKSVDIIALMSPGLRYLGLDSLAHVKEYGARQIMVTTPYAEKDKGAELIFDTATELGAKGTFDVYNDPGTHGTRVYERVDGVDGRIARFIGKEVRTMQGTKVFAKIGGNRFYPNGHPVLEEIPIAQIRIFSSAEEARKRGLKPAK